MHLGLSCHYLFSTFCLFFFVNLVLFSCDTIMLVTCGRNSSYSFIPNFWNFAGVSVMVWRCAYEFGVLLYSFSSLEPQRENMDRTAVKVMSHLHSPLPAPALPAPLPAPALPPPPPTPSTHTQKKKSLLQVERNYQFERNFTKQLYILIWCMRSCAQKVPIVYTFS